MLKKNFDIFLNIALIATIGLLYYSQNSLHHEFHDFVEKQEKTQIAPPSKSNIPDTKKETSPHAQLINKIETESETRLSKIVHLIIRDEGIRETAYADSRGNITIGAGRSLQTNGISITELHAIVPSPEYRKILLHTKVANGRIYIDSLKLADEIFPNPLTKHDIALLLTDDLKNTTQEAQTVFPNWNSISEPRREAILDVLYNTGLPHFKTFSKFINEIKSQNWEAAANELLTSKYAHTHILRASRNAAVLRTDNDSYFELN